jgi:hypothetical protein
MSRIFDALKLAQRTRTGQPRLKPAGIETIESADRRRSRRWSLDVSVYVYGHGPGPGREPFHEEAHTLNVNSNGALLLLSVPVHNGQSLLLTNRITEQEQDCRVVYLGTKHSRTIEAGIEFPAANPDFWQMPYPPEHKPAA